MAKWAAKDVKCPFYQSHTDMQIACEGITINTTLRLSFCDRETRKQHMKNHCNLAKNYENCKIAHMLMEKYY